MQFLPKSFFEKRIQPALVVHHKLCVPLILRQVIADAANGVHVGEHDRRPEVLSIRFEWGDACSDKR